MKDYLGLWVLSMYSELETFLGHRHVLRCVPMGFRLAAAHGLHEPTVRRYAAYNV